MTKVNPRFAQGQVHFTMTMVKYLSAQGCPIVTMVNCWTAQGQLRFTMTM